MSAILDFQALHQTKIYINGFLDPESPKFDPSYASISSIEAEIITFMQKKAAILNFCLLRLSYKYFTVNPLP